MGGWPGQVSKCWFEEAEPIIASPTSSTHTESHRPTGPATQPLHRSLMSSRAEAGKLFHVPAPENPFMTHLALRWLLLVVGLWGEKLSWVGARSPLPGAVTLYGVYTSGAKTPAQGHGREAQGLVLARLATKSRKEGCGTAGLPPPTAEKADDGKTHGHPSPPRTPLVVHCFQGTPCNHQDDNVQR